MELQDRIITYVTACNGLVSLEKLLSVTNAKGFSEDEVLASLTRIGSKLKSTVRAGTIYYQVPPPVKKTPMEHLDWVRDNYPYPLRCKHCEGKLCSICFPFYDPEKDTVPKIKERLYMTREEFKANGKPMPYKKKQYA